MQMTTEVREDAVYLAKLAEQAERYEGAYRFTLTRFCLTSCAFRDGREHEARRLV